MRKRSLYKDEIIGVVNGNKQVISLDEVIYSEEPVKHYTYIITIKCLRCGATYQTTWKSFISKSKKGSKACPKCVGSYMEEKFKDVTGYTKQERLKFSQIKGGAKSRNIDFQLTDQDMHKLINSSCSYCGQEQCNGIDRIDSHKGYIIDNVVPCCAMCNRMKSDYTLETFKSHIQKIHKHLNDDNQRIDSSRF